jgi:hypothetical protein
MTSAMREAEIEGAVRMARHWLRNPGSMVDAGFEQVCRELYTISVALVRVAGAVATEAERET